ncbi:MAG: MarR family transcriptional regulator [Candidatus Zixiibacteriota bacterium]|nr:MAG: MarR family transcriptional regulator [candidate division Zixibacteria bacterium]
MKELGPLAFASRLKRLSNRLMNDVSRIYEENRFEFQPRWFLIAYLLKDESPMSITAIAKRLGLTHPYVIQVSKEMAAHQLIIPYADKEDARRTYLKLSPKGRKLTGKLEEFWIDISQCTQQVIDASGTDVLEGITRIEEELYKKSVYRRVIELRKTRTQRGGSDAK